MRRLQGRLLSLTDAADADWLTSAPVEYTPAPSCGAYSIKLVDGKKSGSAFKGQPRPNNIRRLHEDLP